MPSTGGPSPFFKDLERDPLRLFGVVGICMVVFCLGCQTPQRSETNRAAAIQCLIRVFSFGQEKPLVGDIFVRADGRFEYVQLEPQVSPGKTNRNAGRMAPELFAAITNSLRNTNDWKLVKGVPTYDLSLADHMSRKPDGVQYLALEILNQLNGVRAQAPIPYDPTRNRLVDLETIPRK